MFIETELAKREIRRAAEKIQKPDRCAILDSDIVAPRKRETGPSGTELKTRPVETANRVEQNRTAEGLSLRDLTDGEKQRLRNIGMSSANVEKCKVDSRGVFHLECRNSIYEGKRHPVSDVSFERRRISINGVTIEGVFPKFQSVTELRLPENLQRAAESKQFDYLNTQLREAIDRNPGLRAKFTDQQIEMIKSGRNPAGYTWHHNESRGVMQLVETKTHAITGHTGGDSIWCSR